MIVALPRPALGELRDAQQMAPDEQRRYVASLKREAEALRSALHVHFFTAVMARRLRRDFAAVRLSPRDAVRLPLAAG